MDRIPSGTPRRLFMVGGLLAALVVLGRAQVVQANHAPGSCGNHAGQALLLGCNNAAESSTELATTNGYGLDVQTTGEDDAGIRARGALTGVMGHSPRTGVFGLSDGGDGVRGSSPTTGVRGVSDTTGVLGEVTRLGGGAGVKGVSPTTGVWGVSQNEGVTGFGDQVGVRARSSAIALKVEGRAHFSRSGKVSIGAGLNKKDVSMTRLTSATFVTATLQGVPSSGLWVQSVQVVPASDKFTIYLNKAVPSGTTVTVGYFVVK